MTDEKSFEACGIGQPVLRSFAKEISEQFCPFIEPAKKHDVLSFSEYSLNELARIGQGNVAAGLFYVAVVHTEQLRDSRRALQRAGRTAAATLACDNIVVTDTEGMRTDDAKNMVDWPHYLLKLVYSKSALMFGKFWTGEEVNSLDGRAIPKTPVTFLSIRSSVRRRDPSLLREQHEFAEIISEAVDDGADVLLSKTGISKVGLTADSLAKSNCFHVLMKAS